MSNEFFFPVLLDIIIFIILLETVLGENSTQNTTFRACEPKNCGANITISYPFWINGEHESYCGHPEFQISCTEGKIPILHISDEDYLIHNIFYKNQSLILTNAAAIYDEPNCPIPHRNFTVVGSPFLLSTYHIDLYFFYNCSLVPTNYSVFPITCAKGSNESLSSYATIIRGQEGKKFMNSSSENCESLVSVPIDMEEGMSLDSLMTKQYSDLVKEGFVLTWNSSVSTDCTACQRRGGRCGFENTTFVCFCDGSPQNRCINGAAIYLGSTRRKSKIIIGVMAAFGAVVLCLSTIKLIQCLKKEPSFDNDLSSPRFWRVINKNDQNIEAFLRTHGSLAPKRYSYMDVKKMTNSFKEKLGEGGCGSVFKGRLHDGRLVAVKVLVSKPNRDDNGEDFINEVASISRTSHVNIVTLLGFCYGKHNQKALIYEFMPNGSLDRFIYGKDLASSEPSGLIVGWEILYQFAIGIARGLEYLHRGCTTRILHFDIKPHNILLDEEFSPKIADFGLAKLCPQKESIISMLGARGTAGYIAPEVFSRNFGGISHKSDVYSYGMMVLEVVGSRKNFDVKVGMNHSSQLYFPDWIYDRLIQDQDLGLHGVMTKEREDATKKMIVVGLWCIQTNPLNRPSMSKVLEMLEGNVEALEIPPKPFLSTPPNLQQPSISSSTISIS
ncbi:hypothetical protein C5167_032056 [Papaver somniferum]|uniref:Protein kinase domain-containing protein n=1 Tax=Papaver somniferum TaxID=3469 RepID=A0A4Y7K9A9_PAPSO|nr:LEAF RUST 10 DISEASE-RESISTANCE LOCUS RECEPTOR-LIKE PROTEIN KINASE-like 2.5 [Papaver somniferum]RZC68801.1 hypothetical protein C5167_032056 [Papaver somniferum]